MKHAILSTLIFTFLIISVYAQEDVVIEKKQFKLPDKKEGFSEAWDFVQEGDVNYNEKPKGFYLDALEQYLNAFRYNQNNAALNYKIGVCYLKTKQRTKALEFFKKAFEQNQYVSGDIHLMLATSYHLINEFDKAIEEYGIFISSATPSQKIENQALIDQRIKECQNGKILLDKPLRIFVDNMSSRVNTLYPEYSPFVSADETVLFFTSRRDNTTGGEVDFTDKMYFEDIYISKNMNGLWQKPINAGKPLNDKEHDATAGLAADGQVLYIYRENNGGDIYECKLKGETWSSPKALPSPVNTDAHESSAAISPDGNSLYFTSNRKENNSGKHDIYVSKRDSKGRWGTPVNLGNVVNTSGDEASIFLHPDGQTLYFSSEGHNSMGGYDIYRTVRDENGKWSKPENLGYPMNTADDDLFFVMAADGKHAYYASVRPEGYGETDLYMVTFLNPELLVQSNEDNLLAGNTTPIKEPNIEQAVEIKTIRLTILKGTITDAITNTPVETSIEIVDNEKNEIISVLNSNVTTGKYLLALPSGKNYGIAVKAEGYLFHSENVNVPPTTAYQEITKDIQLFSVKKEAKIILNNVFFETAKWDLLPESNAELDRLAKLLTDYPNIRIEISGHTDNTGSKTFNVQLSKNRAESVVNGLVSRGILASRMEFAGYADQQPIATNDTPEGRQLNRRVEFKVLTN